MDIHVDQNRAIGFKIMTKCSKLFGIILKDTRENYLLVSYNDKILVDIKEYNLKGKLYNNYKIS